MSMKLYRHQTRQLKPRSAVTLTTHRFLSMVATPGFAVVPGIDGVVVGLA